MNFESQSLKQEKENSFETEKQLLFNSAQESLDFITSKKIAAQMAAAGVYFAEQILDGRIDHMFFIDKSARIVGIYIHYILSQFDTADNRFSQGKVFFIYANRKGEVKHYFKNDDDLKNILQKKEKLFTDNNVFNYNKLEKNRIEEVKVTNFIIDEYVSTGKTIKSVTKYFNRISEPEEVLNIPQALWADYRKEQLPIVLFKDGGRPNWFDDKTISGLSDKGDIVKPLKDKDDRNRARAARENLRKSAKYIAEYIKIEMSNKPTQNQPWKQYLRKDEKRENTIESIDLYHLKIAMKFFGISDYYDFNTIHNLNDAYMQAKKLIKDEDDEKKEAGDILIEHLKFKGEIT